MVYKQTTQVPNFVFDCYLPQLSMAELKIFLVIIRQTYGWIDSKTGQRKTRDRISHSQFQSKTGLSLRSTINAIQSLQTKKMIIITDTKGSELLFACDRKGKKYLYYSTSLSPVTLLQTSAKNVTQPVQKMTYNKTNYTKTNRHFTGHIKTLMDKYAALPVGIPA